MQLMLKRTMRQQQTE